MTVKKSLEEHMRTIRKKIINDPYNEYKVIEKEHEMERLYWSRHGFYADAEYVKTNG